jgi:predicted NAD-dependent protein-ADP-ribosyltransferase YbiA (DUF1768 family)
VPAGVRACLVHGPASPLYRARGIGLAADDARAAMPERWPGLNLLGFALMEVRSQLRDQHAA